MRFKEFLIEYDRKKTIDNFGRKILTSTVDGKHLFDINMKATSFPTRIAAAEHVLSVIFDDLEATDPTPNKQYTLFLVKWLLNGARLEDLFSRGSSALKKFHLLKQRQLINLNDRDIGKYHSFDEFEEKMAQYKDVDDRVVNKGNIEVFYEDKDLRILIPLDMEAAIYYGQGTRWCTASTNNNLFKNYNPSGPLYIILPKKPALAGEKWQFHFSSGQFMDETDNRVDLFELCDRYPQLREVFSAEASKKHVIALMYARPAADKYQKACHAAVRELINTPSAQTELKNLLGDDIQRSFKGAISSSRYKNGSTAHVFKNAIHYCEKIKTPSDPLLNQILDYILRYLEQKPHTFADKDNYVEMMQDGFDDLMRNFNNSFGNITQPVLDDMYDLYGEDNDEVMYFCMELMRDMADSEFSNLLFALLNQNIARIMQGRE